LKEQGIYILLISVHGLVRGHAPELGRDPDTGGQVLYVLELAKALALHPGVAQVDLLTRLVQDPGLPPDYACPEEALGPHARILRLPFGPDRYVRKELLWDHLDYLVDSYLAHARSLARLPDVIHSHYADAGYVALRLSSLLGIPFIHSGHSLGRCKQQRLLAAGRRQDALERTFHFGRRIQVEEEVLAHAALVITSTRQEIVDQYGLYSSFQPARAAVLAPGTDTSRFAPPRRPAALPAMAGKVDRFLKDPGLPMLLCIGRPVPGKNLQGLVRAYGEDPELRRKANLVLVAGNRQEIRDLDKESRDTWKELLLAIDRYDLYGRVAIPKSHEPADIPDLYRLAALRGGLYVNPAFAETFGLTLIEAAASGLPLAVTSTGGPKDIVANCRNGVLFDAIDPAAIAASLREGLASRKRWREWSRNGLRGVRSFYTWSAHVERYLAQVRRILRKGRKRRRKDLAALRPGEASPFLRAERVLICDLEATLVGEPESMARLLAWIRRNRERVAFGIATGRKLDSTLWQLRKAGVDPPDLLITSVGSDIRYGPDWIPDAGWEHHISKGWRREELARVLRDVPGLRLQAQRALGPHKLSYHANPARLPELSEIYGLLHRQGLRAKLVYSQSKFLDVLPAAASKGQAVRYLAIKWGLPLGRFIVAGDSGNDYDMLTGDTLGIVVANHSPELERLRGRERIHFAGLPFAAGIMEGMEHYGVACDS
jgi:sucrose-phosphate synthase